MKNDAHAPKNSLAAMPNQLPASAHFLVASQGRGPVSVTTFNCSSLFQEVHHA